MHLAKTNLKTAKIYIMYKLKTFPGKKFIGRIRNKMLHFLIGFLCSLFAKEGVQIVGIQIRSDIMSDPKFLTMKSHHCRKGKENLS